MRFAGVYKYWIAGGLLLLLAVIVLWAGQTGCVRRRLTVRSNPPGALVYIDDRPIGKTPVSTPLSGGCLTSSTRWTPWSGSFGQPAHRATGQLVAKWTCGRGGGVESVPAGG